MGIIFMVRGGVRVVYGATLEMRYYKCHSGPSDTILCHLVGEKANLAESLDRDKLWFFREVR